MLSVDVRNEDWCQDNVLSKFYGQKITNKINKTNRS